MQSLRAVFSLFVFLVVLYLGYFHQTCIYLLKQGSGQLHILINAKPISYTEDLNTRAFENLLLIDSLKRFSIDSMAYDPTENYTTIYNHGSDPVLWVITASAPFSLSPVQWNFPIVGKVSYKGFFDKQLAAFEYDELKSQGYDVEVSPVTAYSSLGWFNDPVFSGMLERSKGAFCNLILHELFHATFYETGNVNLNENLANFIAHKGTVRFLSKDTLALKAYTALQIDRNILRNYLKRKAGELRVFYSGLSEHDPDKKAMMFRSITDSLPLLPLFEPDRAAFRAKEISAAENAFFVGYAQYESLQDSIEIAFNKIYRGNIQNMVRDLKRR